MKLQQKLNIIFSLIILLLIITILNISNSNKNQHSIQIKPNLLKTIEVSQPKEIIINGLIFASTTEDVQMKVNAKIDASNRVLEVGSKFKKNEILISAERLDALYELIVAKSQFKILIQNLVINLNKLNMMESEKWKQFESHIKRTSSLPTLPILKSVKEEQIVNKLNIVSQFYITKKIEDKAKDYVYLAPFDGIITDKLIDTGLTIISGKTILKLAKNDSYKVVAHAKLENLERIKIEDTVIFQNLEGQILSKGVFLRVGNYFSDSLEVELYYSIKNQNLLNQPVQIIYPPKEITVPS